MEDNLTKEQITENACSLVALALYHYDKANAPAWIVNKLTTIGLLLDEIIKGE